MWADGYVPQLPHRRGELQNPTATGPAQSLYGRSDDISARQTSSCSNCPFPGWYVTSSLLFPPAPLPSFSLLSHPSRTR